MDRDLTLIGKFPIAHNAAPFVIAECCNNFQGSFDIALRMIAAAADCGAHAVKFQHRGRLSVEQFSILRRESDRVGLEFLCTAYTPEGLIQIGPFVDAIKIGSAEVLDPEMRATARAIAGSRPIIASLGGCEEADVEDIVAHIGDHPGGCILLQTTSEYPTSTLRVGLGNIARWRFKFGGSNRPKLITGYSDHTGRPAFPIAAMALGAAVVEVHFTLSKHLPGPDQCVSHEPQDLEAIATFARALPFAASATKTMFAEEMTKLSLFRKVWSDRPNSDKGNQE